MQEAINTKGQTEPYITILGSYSAAVQAFLVTDCCVVFEVKIEESTHSFLFLISSIQKDATMLIHFSEYALFSLDHKK